MVRITPKTESFLPFFPFHTYPENFIKIRSLVFELSYSQTNKLTNPQTNPGENITSSAEVILTNKSTIVSYNCLNIKLSLNALLDLYNACDNLLLQET